MGGRVQDRVIVVTGAGRGQGAAEVAALAAEGAFVIGADLDLRAVVETGERITYRELEVADPAGWEALADFARERFGRVDGLINNAGTTSRVRLGEVRLADWNRVLAVNVTGAMLGIQALMPLIAEGGSIVNVGSVAGLTGHYTAAYTTSKWALRGLTQCAATELAPRGIRVNAVHPGYIETEMTAGAPAGFREVNVALTPVGRPGQADEVAALMVFLMSTESSFISGAEIPIDGGFTGGGIAKTISDALRIAAEA
jgi:3alpha(or 20beta)-hydroxysteroid dehydrogenase